MTRVPHTADDVLKFDLGTSGDEYDEHDGDEENEGDEWEKDDEENEGGDEEDEGGDEEDEGGDEEDENCPPPPPPPCLVAGSLIDTPSGSVPVETIEPGDLVMTRDDGAQPVCWCGRATRRALGRDAPVAFSAGALGDHAATELSQNHRVLLRGARAQLLFGEDEILVKAKDLVNGQSIRLRQDGAPVTYVHLLFARHQIIRGDGLESESYYPGPETLGSFDADTRGEILRLMPDAPDGSGPSYGPSARRSLRGYESRALLGR